MTYRRLQRELKGTYTKQRRWVEVLWVLAFVGLEVGLVSITNTEGFFSLELKINVLTNPVRGAAGDHSAALVPVLDPFGSIVALVLAPGEGIQTLTNYNFSSSGIASVIGGFVGFACLLNILLWYYYNKVYPHAVRDGRSCMKDPSWYFRVRPLPERPGFYAYRIPMPFPFWLPCFAKECTFGYIGEVDAQGRPHGLGTWQDDARHGECLQGVWEHGWPIGPFRASE
eukprot:CAMPEP_0115840146 /NCGR_PEP_ID=MMETSP0287-20121206/6620_1 /TAXON_ID=412157 /ORGANISM="Chrysochromulina rotalis, Strain UIO044" /LENGTH=226 /DNA_ID=CAMNT_0003293747 /DNA_START=18 /DNA_END=696 /DNA_ORIENTATION=-